MPREPVSAWSLIGDRRRNGVVNGVYRHYQHDRNAALAFGNESSRWLVSDAAMLK